MRFVDFLKATVMLSAGSATFLATLTVLSVREAADATLMEVAIGWWLAAALIGAWLGRRNAASPPIARLLADARMDAICWNGTSGAWKGLGADRRICEAITTEIGAPATTGTLAQVEAFGAHGIARYGLAVPYTADVRDAIVRVYGEAGFACVRSAHLGMSTNFDFAEVGLDRLRDLIRAADAPDAEAIVVVCTNLAAARVVEELERELGKPVHDSLVVSLWHPLRLLGWEAPIAGWGRLMRELG